MDIINGNKFEEYFPPSWDVYFMRLSYEVATKSKDPSTKFGAVLVKNKRAISFGYNGLPPGVQDLPERLQPPIKYKWITHAEKNAIACAARFGIGIESSSLYIFAMPCAQCASMLSTSGIIEVIIHRPASIIFSKNSKYGEDDDISKLIFKESNIKLRYIEEKMNKIGYIGGKTYNL
jgi:dCMP deaminase